MSRCFASLAAEGSVLSSRQGSLRSSLPFKLRLEAVPPRVPGAPPGSQASLCTRAPRGLLRHLVPGTAAPTGDSPGEWAGSSPTAPTGCV